MSRFPLIFRHYFKRNALNPINLAVYLALPVALVVLNVLGNIGVVEMNVGDIDLLPETVVTQFTTMLAAAFMVSFQFFSGELLLESIYSDFREGPQRWRLLATPVPQRTFLAGLSASSWALNLVQGILIFGIIALAFGVYWGNLLVFIAVLLLISIMSQLLAALFSLLIPKQKLASIVWNLFCFAQMLLAGFFFVPLGDSAFATFMATHGTPLSLGWRAIAYAGPVLYDMSSALFNIGILAAITAVIALAVIILSIGRRKKA